MLQAVLTKWGYDVTAVSDGKAALSAIQADAALQLTVLDWMMPAMDVTCQGFCQLLPHWNKHFP